MEIFGASMKTFCQQHSIKHILNAVATPRANGQCERYNQIICDSLKCLSVNDPDETHWDKHVKEIKFSLNTAKNKTTGESPYKILIGINPRHWADAYIVNAVADTLSRVDLSSLRAEVEAKVTESQRQYKKTFDRKRCKPKQYVVGDLVM